MKIRLFTALIAAPLAIAFFLTEDLIFTHIVFAIFSLLLTRELLKLSKHPLSKFSLLSSYSFVFIFSLTSFASFYFNQKNEILKFFYLSTVTLTFLFFLVTASHAIFCIKVDEKKISFALIYEQLIYKVFIFLFAGFFFYHIILLKYVNSMIFPYNGLFQNFFAFYWIGTSLPSFDFAGLNAGEIYLIYSCLITWGYDSFAYVFGKSFGKKKLSIDASPQKSVAGLIGGTLSTLLIVLVIYNILAILQHRYSSYQSSLVMLPLFSSNLNVLIFSTVLIYVAQLGDLFASLLKRVRGVKDSGSLFPGHGGLLDRLDAFIFVVPTLFYLVVWSFFLWY